MLEDRQLVRAETHLDMLRQLPGAPLRLRGAWRHRHRRDDDQTCSDSVHRTHNRYAVLNSGFC